MESNKKSRCLMKKCKHIYKPIKFIECRGILEGRTEYVYQVQCMECGKKHHFGCFEIYRKTTNQMQALSLPYELIKDKGNEAVFSYTSNDKDKQMAAGRTDTDQTEHNGDYYAIIGKGKDEFVEKLKNLNSSISEEGYIIKIPDDASINTDDYAKLINSIREDVQIVKI